MFANVLRLGIRPADLMSRRSAAEANLLSAGKMTPLAAVIGCCRHIGASRCVSAELLFFGIAVRIRVFKIYFVQNEFLFLTIVIKSNVAIVYGPRTNFPT